MLQLDSSLPYPSCRKHQVCFCMRKRQLHYVVITVAFPFSSTEYCNLKAKFSLCGRSVYSNRLLKIVCEQSFAVLMLGRKEG
ncbi:hypothetical protein RvY_06466 [Ramazzottius varieornatus]|uniref:Uncharacterized protein n=1 Tax=Ramazzottius varieornatus TaxID=947166 RepID=A0A1D1V7D3_RAMVA|nr:hypothetical protein RvY_06466 [Ramazzottius varieornatus]